jgi:hypothetical protein
MGNFTVALFSYLALSKETKALFVKCSFLERVFSNINVHLLSKDGPTRLKSARLFRGKQS